MKKQEWEIKNRLPLPAGRVKGEASPAFAALDPAGQEVGLAEMEG